MTAGEIASSRRPTWKVLAIFALLLGLGVLVRLYHFEEPLMDRHLFRQIDTAAIARNFYEEEMNILYPRVDWRGESTGYVEMEFQGFTFMVAALYHVFGAHDAVGRGLNIFFWALAVMLLFRLTRSLFGDRGALFAVFFFSFNPLTVFFTRSFQPDSMLSLMSMAAVFYFWKWTEDDRKRSLVLSGLALMLAVSIKPPSLYLGLPLLYLCLRTHGWSFLKMGRLWGYVALVVVPPVLWYWHALNMWNEHGNTFGILGKHTVAGVWKWHDPRWVELAKNLVERTRLEFVPAPAFFFLLVGFFQRSLTKNAVLLWWAAGFAVYIVLVPEGHWGHDYYQMPLLFALAAWTGAGAAHLHSAGMLGRGLAAVGAVVFLAYGALEVKGMFYIKPSHERRVWFNEEIAKLTESDAMIVFVSPQPEDPENKTLYRHRTPEGYELYCDPIDFYLSHRKGWSLDNVQAVPGYVEALRQKGAKYVATFEARLISPELRAALDASAKALHTNSAWVIYRLGDTPVAAAITPPGE